MGAIFASSLKDDLRYTPTDCFETFPFPTGWEKDAALEAAGREYYEHRAALMVRHDEGLTTTYTRFHARHERDPDLLHLRDLHTQMDRAVLAAYGWTDLPTACEFIPDYIEEGPDGEPLEKSLRYRWPDLVRDEVLARLLKLNAERAEEERLLAEATAEKPKRTKRKPSAPAPQIELFPQTVPSPVVPLGTPWKERIAAFQLSVPNGKPSRPQVPLLYYRLLLPALVQEAGDRLPLQLLYAAVVLLADRDWLKENLAALAVEQTQGWFRTFNAPIDPNAFNPALDDALQVAKTLRVIGEWPNLELRLTKQIGESAPWIRADARIALAAAVKLAAEKTPAIPHDLREKIIQFSTAA